MMRVRFITMSSTACAVLVASAVLAGSSGCKREPKPADQPPATPTTPPATPTTPSAAPSEPAKAGSATKIGIVFDVGGLGDKSFNDAAHRGLVRAKAELGVQTQYIEPGDGSDRESALRQRAAAGDNLVIGIGFIFSDDITKLAAQ